MPLTEDDRRKLEEQNWDENPDFQSLTIIVRHGLLRPTYELAKRKDGSCVFLMEDGLCRIHKDFGFTAKPQVCQSFPLQLVPIDDSAVLTLRRACPSAVLDKGRPVQDHIKEARRIAQEGGLIDRPIRPPAISSRYQGTWHESLLVLNAIERLMTDARFPVVRRLANASRFCNLLDQCRLHKLKENALGELVLVLEKNAVDEGSAAFQDRQPLPRSSGALFRQAAAEHVRLLSSFVSSGSWRERWQLIRAAWRFATGVGTVPAIHPGLPETEFDDLERPLGALPSELYGPLARFYETTAITKQYAIASRVGWPIVDKFRALALSYPIALWILRWIATGRNPTQDDVVAVIVAIDRAQGYAPLARRSHRSRVRTLASLGGIEASLAWYGR